MKHIRKFEELNYETYISASDKLSQHGQKQRGEKVKSHAIESETKKIKDISFDILVGDTRIFNDAKFHSVRVMREKNANAVMVVFESLPNNTHRVLATINPDGTVTWRDFNKFASRKSVNDYQSALRKLAGFEPDLKKMVEEMGLKPSELRVVPRTFYV